MVYDIITTESFESDVDYYIKKKKYTNILTDLEPVITDLKQGNLVGDVIPNLKNVNPTVKVRIANSNINGGKSNGYRLIYYAVTDDNEIYLLIIYSKKDDKRIPSSKTIISLVNQYVG